MKIISFVLIITGINCFDWKLTREERIAAGFCGDRREDLCFHNGTKRIERQFTNLTDFDDNFYCSCDLNCELYGDCCMDMTTGFKSNYRCININGKFGLYAINECNLKWNQTDRYKLEIQEKCDSINSYEPSDHYLYSIPVYSDRSGKFYKNIFCSICNDDPGTVSSSIKLNCGNQSGRTTRTIPQDDELQSQIIKQIEIKSNYKENQRIWEFYLHGIQYQCSYHVDDFNYENLINHFGARICRPSIDSCPASVLDQQLKKKCTSYTSYIFNVYLKIDSFKNYHCYICNNQNPKQLSCKRYRGNVVFPRTSLTTPLTITMDLTTPIQTFARRAGRKRCSKNQYYDYIKHECTTLYCGYLFKWDPRTKKCIRRSVSEFTNNETLLISDCPKILISESDYTLTNEVGTIYINSTGETYSVGSYEQARSVNGSLLRGILICVTESFLVIPFNKANLGPQILLTELSLSISIVCLFIHLCVYFYVPKLRNLPGKNLMSLSSALLIAHLMFLLSGFAEPNASNWTCIISALMIQYSFLAAFFWMNVMSFDIWSTFKGKVYSRNLKSSQTFLKYSIYSWLSPAVIVLISFSSDIFIEESTFKPLYGSVVCWINQKNALVLYFIGPLAIILAVNLIFYCLTIKEISKTKQQSKMIKHQINAKNNFFLYLRLALIMGMTWCFGFVAAFLGHKPLWYLFIMFNGLQGSFIFTSFILKKKIYYMVISKYSDQKSSAYFNNTRMTWKTTITSTKLTNHTTSI